METDKLEGQRGLQMQRKMRRRQIQKVEGLKGLKWEKQKVETQKGLKWEKQSVEKLKGLKLEIETEAQQLEGTKNQKRQQQK